MPDLEVIFRTKAELQGAMQLQQSLEKQIGTAKALGQTTTELEGRYNRVSKAIEEFNQKVAASGDSLSIAKGNFDSLNPVFDQMGLSSSHAATAVEGAAGKMNLAATAAAALAAATAAGAKGVKEFAEEEQGIMEQDAALANHGNMVDEVREKYAHMARELEQATSITESKWRSVITTLTKRGIEPEQMDQAVEGVKNLAGLMGGNVEKAATLMAKAMNGSVGVLKRYGVTVDQSASKSEQLASAFEQLKAGSGLLEAKGQGLAGQWKQVGNEFHHFWVGIGELISRTQVLQRSMWLLTNILQALNRYFPETIEHSSKLENRFSDLKEETEDLAEGVMGAASAFGGTGGLASELGKTKNKADEALDSLKAVDAEIERGRRLADALLDNETAEKISGVDLAEAQGKMTKAEADLERGRLRGRANEGKAQQELLEATRKKEATEALRFQAQNQSSSAKAVSDAKYGAFTDKADALKMVYNPQRIAEEADAASKRLNKLQDVRTKYPNLANPSLDAAIDKEQQRVAELSELIKLYREYKKALGETNKAQEHAAKVLGETNQQLLEEKAAIIAATGKVSAALAEHKSSMQKAQNELSVEKIAQAEKNTDTRLRTIHARLTEAGDTIDPTEKARLQGEEAHLRVEQLRRRQAAPGATADEKANLEAQIQEIVSALKGAFLREFEQYGHNLSSKDHGSFSLPPVNPLPFYNGFEHPAGPALPGTGRGQGDPWAQLRNAEKVKAAGAQTNAAIERNTEATVGAFEEFARNLDEQSASIVSIVQNLKNLSNQVANLRTP
jgi:hypothetical protein